MGVSLSFFGPYCDYRLFNTCYFNVNISFHTDCNSAQILHRPIWKTSSFLVWFGLVWKTSLFVWFFLTWATSEMQPRPRFWCRSSPPRDSQICILTLSGEASGANLNIIIIVVILGVFLTILKANIAYQRLSYSYSWLLGLFSLQYWTGLACTKLSSMLSSLISSSWSS